MKSRTKLWLAVGVGLLILVLVLVGVKAGQIGTMVRAGESFAPPPEAVAATRVEQVEWVATRDAVASLVSDRGVTLGTEVPGAVREITFEPGSSVKKGQVLVRLDASTERAQLDAAAAEAALAELSLERAGMLRRNESSSQSDLDAAEARAKQARAAVANAEAALGKKTIRAPFDGRISLRQVELGQILAPGAAIASLQSVSPIHADFWVPQQALSELKAGQRVRLGTDAYPDAGWDGRITTVNPEVDPATRNVRVRATFENKDGRLRPGMFAGVEIFAAEAKPRLVIPATAVIYAPYGDSVFAVEERKDEKTGQAGAVARQKFVRLGERRGDFVAVVSGLAQGETIVSRGAFKLRNGAPVAVGESNAPKAELSPRPTDE